MNKKNQAQLPELVCKKEYFSLQLNKDATIGVNFKVIITYKFETDLTILCVITTDGS